MGWTRYVAAGVCAVLITSAVWPGRTARADDDATKTSCREAYEGSQIHRRKGEILAARQNLRACASEACPAVVRADCVQWLGEVESSVPSIVLEAKTDAGAVFDVTTKMDGKVIATQLDGRPIELDPGVHSFTFERAGSPTKEDKIIIREGERSRLISVNWATPAPLRPPEGSTVPMDRPVPAPVYVLAGVAVLGIADFVVFGLIGTSKKNELSSSGTGCAPFCTNDQVSPVKTDFIVSDIGLGVGIAAFAVASGLFLARPERAKTDTSPAPASAYNVVFAPSRSGGVVGLRGLF